MKEIMKPDNVLPVLFTLTILAVILFISLIYSTTKDIKKTSAENKKISKQLDEIKTPEDWIQAKTDLEIFIRSRYRKAYQEEKISGSLYGFLAKKAEELFKNNMK